MESFSILHCMALYEEGVLAVLLKSGVLKMKRSAFVLTGYFLTLLHTKKSDPHSKLYRITLQILGNFYFFISFPLFLWALCFFTTSIRWFISLNALKFPNFVSWLEVNNNYSF